MLGRPRRPRVWSPKAVPLGALIVLLGLWAAVVPLVGPYFDFGFDTSHTWRFSEPHVTLSIVPGLAAALGGLTLAVPARGPSGFGRTLATLAGIWLLVGASFHPIWSNTAFAPHGGSDWKRALLWVGYFYGVGALVVYFAGIARGLVTRRARVEETMVAEPQYERAVSEG